MRGRPLRRRRRGAATLALLLVVCACEAPRDEEPISSPPRGTTHWGQLGSWSGEGDRQTESFDITSGALRLKWETANEVTPGDGRLRVSLHSAISGRPLETLVDVEGLGADSVRAAAGPRVAYLLIESDGLDWLLTLEEGVMGSADVERSGSSR